MNRKLLSAMLILVLILILLPGCSMNKDEGTDIRCRYASQSEGAELLLTNKAYYDGYSQNDLDYKMQKKGATMDEYQAFAKEQVQEFTEDEKALIDGYIEKMNTVIKGNGYDLPPIDEIVFIKTTMEEEGGAGGYTHGTQIYVWGEMMEATAAGDDTYAEYLDCFFWHELFHCLTKCNPDFRKDMYKLIHFTIQDKDYEIPESLFEYHISNPDVEHHDSYASFHIDGKDIDCFTDFVTTKHFEKKGESFFDTGTTALVPVDGSDTYYTPEQADNFNDVFGTNTDYVIDPEECLADNFSFALAYGKDGPDGKGYPNPEIIDGIIEYLSR